MKENVTKQVSEMMSKASRARSSESRKAGGRKAWQTRLAKLAAQAERGAS